MQFGLTDSSNCAQHRPATSVIASSSKLHKIRRPGYTAVGLPKAGLSAVTCESGRQALNVVRHSKKLTMEKIDLRFDEINYTFPLTYVRGTEEHHFLFGLENDLLKIRTNDFFISQFQVTQILWKQVMGHNPANSTGDNYPVETVSYDDIMAEGGFLEKLNSRFIKEIGRQFKKSATLQFRLPTETEWEYAARGGIYWGDYFVYSGGDNIDEVSWYKRNSGDRSKPVGQKNPNQLGLHDMSGNVWEWCQDYYHEDTTKIPRDGTSCLEPSESRVLRGGCFHNFAMHCTVMKRYSITPDHKDPCIGFRLVLSA
jgi:sulfatase modifying factor 1